MRSSDLGTNTMQYGRQQLSASGALQNAATESNTRSRAGVGSVDAENNGCCVVKIYKEWSTEK